MLVGIGQLDSIGPEMRNQSPDGVPVISDLTPGGTDLILTDRVRSRSAAAISGVDQELLTLRWCPRGLTDWCCATCLCLPSGSQ